MRHYHIGVRWRRNGTGYEMYDRITIQATSIKTAIQKALGPRFRKARKAWREPMGAVVRIEVLVGGYVAKENHEPQGEKEATHEQA